MLGNPTQFLLRVHLNVHTQNVMWDKHRATETLRTKQRMLLRKLTIFSYGQWGDYNPLVLPNPARALCVFPNWGMCCRLVIVHVDSNNIVYITVSLVYALEREVYVCACTLHSFTVIHTCVIVIHNMHL